MALTATFYNFAKRQNSTAAPAAGTGTVYNVVLKDETSLLDPVLTLTMPTTPAYNYMQLLGRYYHITDIRSLRNNIWEVSGAVDVLGTYKANIQASSAFVAYDTDANTEITDRRISTVTTSSRRENAGNAWDYLGSGFCVMLNVVGETACATYAVSMANAITLLDTMGQWLDDFIPNTDPDDPPADWLEKLTDSITKGFRQLISSGSAADCIRSAFIVPISYGLISGTSEHIMLGNYDTGVTGKKRTTRGIQDASSVAIPWQASDWRRNAPYHEIYLYIPFIGVVSYPASALIGAANIIVDAAIDETAGDAVFTVALGAVSGGVVSQVIGQYTSNIAANFAIGASNITPRQLVTSIGAAAGVAAAAVMTSGAALVAAGTAGIAGELNAVTPLPSSVGGAGGGAVLALFGYVPRCMTIYHNTNVDPASVSAIIGTPAMTVKSLNRTGYVETRNASIGGAMTERERSMLNQLMDGGVYIE